MLTGSSAHWNRRTKVEVRGIRSCTMSDSPVSIHSPDDDAQGPTTGPTQDDAEDGASLCADEAQDGDAGDGGANQAHHPRPIRQGGVGKSTVATGLAVSFAQAGAKVGLLDIDITGPNVPKMMGLTGQRLHVESGRIHPAVGHQGVKVISMAFLLEDEDTPVVWRGPIKLGAIQQFIGDVEWGDLDYLIIDFLRGPPMNL